jgi:hypothetical protein
MGFSRHEYVDCCLLGCEARVDLYVSDNTLLIFSVHLSVHTASQPRRPELTIIFRIFGTHSCEVTGDTKFTL